MNSSKRDYINAVRGTAVFLTIWGHCIQYCCAGAFDFFENRMFRIIYAFHMPLFMLISGYLFSLSFDRRSLRETLARRTRSLLQPIIMCGLLCFLLTGFLYQLLFYGPLSLKGWLLYGIGLDYMNTYWFLWAALSAGCLVAIAFKGFRNPMLRIVFSFLGVFLLWLFPQTTLCVYVYPYFVLGFLFARYEQVLQRIRKLRFLSIPLFPVLMLFYEKKHYIYTTGLYDPKAGAAASLGTDLYRWLVGLVGCVFALVVLEAAFRFLFSRGKGRPVLRFLCGLGEKSLQLYCLQMIVIASWLDVIMQRLAARLGGNPLYAVPAVYDLLLTPLLAWAFSRLLLAVVRGMEKHGIAAVLFGR